MGCRVAWAVGCYCVNAIRLALLGSAASVAPVDLEPVTLPANDRSTS